MRGSWIWLALIALATAAIVAGYVSGARTQPPAIVQLHPNAHPSSRPVALAVVGNERRMFSGGVVDDLFSDDDVVAGRAPVLGDWHAPRLSLVIGLCGRSAAIESRFLELGIPLTFDIDPNAPEAAKLANLARASGATIVVHVDRAPTVADLSSLRARIGDFSGVASRDALPLARPLQGSGLFVFDERGSADPKPFSSLGVPFVSRDVLADNREEQGYVGYMLERALDRSFRSGVAVVLVRPLPSTLQALRSFQHDRSVDFTAIR